MTERVNVHTQGVADDWTFADGDFETKFRGALSHDQVLSALIHLEPLELPDGAECPPHVLIDSADGTVLSFVGQGGAIECLEAGVDVSPEEGVALAFGEMGIEDLAEEPSAPAPPPPPVQGRRAPARGSAQKAAQPRNSRGMKAAGLLGAVAGAAMGGGFAGGAEGASMAATGAAAGAASSQGGPAGQGAPAGYRRKNTWRTYGAYILASFFFLGGLMGLAGIFSARETESKLAAGAMLAVFGGIGWAIVHAANKQRPYVDDDGNVMLGIGMAHMLNDHGSDDGDWGSD